MRIQKTHKALRIVRSTKSMLCGLRLFGLYKSRSGRNWMKPLITEMEDKDSGNRVFTQKCKRCSS